MTIQAKKLIAALESATAQLLSEFKLRSPTPQEAAALLALCAALADLPGVVPEEE